MALMERIRASVKKWLFPDLSYNDFLSLSNDKTLEATTPNTALTFSVVFACVRVISETIATLPLFVYRMNGDNRVKAKEHTLYDLLHNIHVN